MDTSTQSGFSLLETVLAIGIILFGLISLISLSTNSFVSGEITSAEFAAANFAREGIEVVRAHRDSNWLAYASNPTTGPKWNEKLSRVDPTEPGGIDYTAIISLDPTLPGYFDFSPDAIGDTCPGASASVYDCSRVWLHPTASLYFQAGKDSYPTFNPSLYEEQSYSRIISLYPICRNKSVETDEQFIFTGTCLSTLGPLYEQVGIDVISTVEWTTRGQDANYALEEYLYNWQ